MNHDIKWYSTQEVLLDVDTFKRVEVYIAYGHDSSGIEYEGIAYWCNDILEKITITKKII